MAMLQYVIGQYLEIPLHHWSVNVGIIQWVQIAIYVNPFTMIDHGPELLLMKPMNVSVSKLIDLR
jgi:hypothetical protein